MRRVAQVHFSGGKFRREGPTQSREPFGLAVHGLPPPPPHCHHWTGVVWWREGSGLPPPTLARARLGGYTGNWVPEARVEVVPPRACTRTHAREGARVTHAHTHYGHALRPGASPCALATRLRCSSPIPTPPYPPLPFPLPLPHTCYSSRERREGGRVSSPLSPPPSVTLARYPSWGGRWRWREVEEG
jgi:hypothetical protein